MSYVIKIQLCDDDSVIEEIETEATDREQGGKCIEQLAAALDDFFITSPK